MCNPKVDEKSIMTYVSYFREAESNPGTPHRPQLPTSTKSSAKTSSVRHKCLVAGRPARPSVSNAAAGNGTCTPRLEVFAHEQLNIPREVVNNRDQSYDKSSQLPVSSGQGKSGCIQQL